MGRSRGRRSQSGGRKRHASTPRGGDVSEGVRTSEGKMLRFEDGDQQVPGTKRARGNKPPLAPPGRVKKQRAKSEARAKSQVRKQAEEIAVKTQHRREGQIRKAMQLEKKKQDAELKLRADREHKKRMLDAKAQTSAEMKEKRAAAVKNLRGTVDGDASVIAPQPELPDPGPRKSAYDVATSEPLHGPPIPNGGARRGTIEGNLENPTSMNDPAVEKLQSQAPEPGEAALGTGLGPDGENTVMDDVQDEALSNAPNSVFSNIGTTTSAQGIASMSQPRRGAAGVIARPFMRATKSAVDQAFAAMGAESGKPGEMPGIPAAVTRAAVHKQFVAGAHRLHNRAQALRLMKIHHVTI